MVLWENVFFNIPDHVVQVDFPEIAYWSVVEPGMEIFIAHQHVQYIAGYSYGDIRLAFLKYSLVFWVLLNSKP